MMKLFLFIMGHQMDFPQLLIGQLGEMLQYNF